MNRLPTPSEFVKGYIYELKNVEPVDVTVYFNLPVSKEDILKVRSQLEKLGSVKEVIYISREQALEDFRARHKNDEAVRELNKLSDNPFLASLQIKVNNISDYDAITSFLGDGSYKSMINKVSYNELRRIMGSNGK